MVATVTILLLAEARAQPTDTPPGFEQIESAFLAFMQANDLPGASLAIARNGRLVLARGYGVADVEQRQSMQPESLLRFGSIGKTITSIAIMRLVEAGKLDLDASAFALLPDIRPRSGRRETRGSGGLRSGICLRIPAAGMLQLAAIRLRRRSASRSHPRWEWRFRPLPARSFRICSTAARFRSRHAVRLFQFRLSRPRASH